MIRTRFSLWRSQQYHRFLCFISPQFRKYNDLSQRLAAAQAEARRFKAESEILSERLTASQRAQELAEATSQNALRSASISRSRATRARQGEIEARRELTDALKATVNSVMFASGSMLPMFDGVGPTRPQSKWEGKTIPPVNGKQRAREVVRKTEMEFFENLMRTPPVETVGEPEVSRVD